MNLNQDSEIPQMQNSEADAISGGGPVEPPKYWLTLEQWQQDPEFAKVATTEFASSPLREEALKSNGQDGGWARREFLKLMGASMAMASAGCIRRPVEKIVPYAKQPEEVTLGVANHYTTTWTDGAEVFGLLITTKEGRPLKVEGNLNHPLTQGGISARASAHLLSLYDPERLQGPKKNLLNKERTNRDTISATWEQADEAVAAQLAKGGVAVLTGNLSSPATRAVVADFAQAFKARHVTWEPNSYEDIRLGAESSYGKGEVPFYRFDQAKMVVSIDADFLGTWIAPVAFSRQYTQARKNIEKMNRVVVFESGFSLTGANADLRVAIRPSQRLSLVVGILAEIAKKSGASSGLLASSQAKALLERFSGEAGSHSVDGQLMAKIAEDLWAHRGESLVVAGGLNGDSPESVDLQVAVNFLNSVLGNDGKTVDAKNGPEHLRGSHSAMYALIEDMKKGLIKTLIVHRTNPVYGLPESAQFVEAIKQVEMVISTSDRVDETGKLAHYVLPDNHVMESWNDAQSMGGVVSIQQPTIRAMYDTRSFQLSLMTWAFLRKVGPQRLQTFETWYDYLRAFWKENYVSRFSAGKSFDAFWSEALQVGVVGKLASSSQARSFRLESLARIKPSVRGSRELVLYPTIALADGFQLANVSWLQELPDPVTKVVWDNHASLSLATAEKMKLKQGDVVEVKLGKQSLQLPVLIQPGLHDDVVAVAVGFGRTAAGKVANNVGQNAYELVQWSNAGVGYTGASVEVVGTKKKNPLAVTAGHHSMEGRQIVVEASLAEYLKKPSANIKKHPIFNFWPGHQYNGNKWAMAVDLNSCTGCSACVVACQSENNIPVVGKKYVLQGREMHWLRIDRYYVGDASTAQAVFQPVMCQQCDNAPCETVCPVLATVHSSEGLNDMVYNRCVGTRYCANNCPYKVRRFNWFNYAKNIEKPMHMALNPDVTVRTRGVMEKCTFCVHRIKAGRQVARMEERELKDGDVKTACEQSCPTGAIVFGDMNDPNSRVSKMFSQERSYALLEEFHAAPSVRYLSKIRNTWEKQEEA